MMLLVVWSRYCNPILDHRSATFVFKRNYVLLCYRMFIVLFLLHRKYWLGSLCAFALQGQGCDLWSLSFGFVDAVRYLCNQFRRTNLSKNRDRLKSGVNEFVRNRRPE
jgi:hypothetical protein